MVEFEERTHARASRHAFNYRVFRGVMLLAQPWHMRRRYSLETPIICKSKPRENRIIQNLQRIRANKIKLFAFCSQSHGLHCLIHCSKYYYIFILCIASGFINNSIIINSFFFRPKNSSSFRFQHSAYLYIYSEEKYYWPHTLKKKFARLNVFNDS